MNDFLKLIGNCSIVMGGISCLYLIVMPFLQKKYTSKWLYYIWLIVIVGWIIPLRPSIAIALPSQKGSTLLEYNNYQVYNDHFNAIGQNSATAATNSKGISLWYIIMAIWVFGVVGITLYHIFKHIRFIRMVSRWGEKISDSKILSVFYEAKETIGVKEDVKLITFPYINTPMMCGIFRHSILLPTKDYAEDELKLILMHEFIHIKRKDILYKLLIMAATILHWFNPVIYLVARHITMQCELSCDENLVERMGFGSRKEYGMTLIHAARKGININSALAIDFLKSGSSLKRRLNCIMDMSQKKKGLVFLCIVLLLMGNSGIVYGFTNKDTSKASQKISFQLEHLKKNNVVCFKGPYQLRKGDTIRIDVSAGGDPRFIFVDAIKCCSIKNGVYYKQQKLDGISLTGSQSEAYIANDMEGEYSFIVKGQDFSGADDMEGTIEIIRGNN